MSGGLTDNEKVFVEALAGAIGGFAGAVAFYPLDTVKTRIQVGYIPPHTHESTNAAEQSFLLNSFVFPPFSPKFRAGGG